MRDLFSQCMCVCMCLSQSGISICTHLHHVHAQELVSHAMTMEVKDREGGRFLTMEDAEDSTAGPPQLTYFAELSAERMQPAVGDTEKRNQ